jgi:hypothetical protein
MENYFVRKISSECVDFRSLNLKFKAITFSFHLSDFEECINYKIGKLILKSRNSLTDVVPILLTILFFLCIRFRVWSLVKYTFFHKFQVAFRGFVLILHYFHFILLSLEFRPNFVYRFSSHFSNFKRFILIKQLLNATFLLLLLKNVIFWLINLRLVCEFKDPVASLKFCLRVLHF